MPAAASRIDSHPPRGPSPPESPSSAASTPLSTTIIATRTLAQPPIRGSRLVSPLSGPDGYVRCVGQGQPTMLNRQDCSPRCDKVVDQDADVRCGQGRKTDDTGAHSTRWSGCRSPGLHPVVSDDQLELRRLLVDWGRRVWH